MKFLELLQAIEDKLILPDLETGDELMVGKFKNRKATIKGFKKDKKNQPIAKTDKGDQQIFKGRLKKLMDKSITEIHYKDAWPKEFETFFKKYRKIVRNGKAYNLYVNFSNYAASKRHSAFAKKTNHTDPIGLYTYPLEYVVKYPMDIWYGMNAKYMRVIQSQSKKPYVISKGMSWYDAVDQFRAIGRYTDEWTDDDELRKLAKQYHNNAPRSVKPARALLSRIQFDMTKEPIKSADWREPEHVLRSGGEQSKIFLGAGYDMIIDAGTGAINPREPEQAIFLSKSAFKVIDHYTLDDTPLDGNSGPMTIGSGLNNPRLSKKIATLVAATIGDRITNDKPYTANMNGARLYWTDLGRRIVLNFNYPASYYDERRFGEKKHKQFKTHTSEAISIEVLTEMGKLTANGNDGSSTVADLVGQIKRQYYELKDASDGLQPTSNRTGETVEKFKAWTSYKNGVNAVNRMDASGEYTPEKMAEIEQRLKQQYNDFIKRYGPMLQEGQIVKNTRITEADKFSYHVTHHDIDEFNPLTHFGTKGAAKGRNKIRYGNTNKLPIRTYRAKLDIKNPVLMWDHGKDHQVSDIVVGILSVFNNKQAKKLYKTASPGNFTYDELNELSNMWNKRYDYSNPEFFTPPEEENKRKKELSEFLKSHGHDGIKYINRVEGRGTWSYISLDSVVAESIKT